MRNRKVLVTGAAGFIGAHLLSALIRQDARVHSLVRETTDLWRLDAMGVRTDFMRMDLCDFGEVSSAVSRLQPEFVFHLAVSRDQDDRQTTLDTNVGATLNLLRAASGPALKRFVHLGSSLEFGKPTAMVRETDPLRPLDYYGATRASASLMLRQAAHENRLPIVILRTFYVYGPMEPAGRLIPTAIRACLKQLPMHLTDPSVRHDFIYVDDVVRACMMAACQPELTGLEFNIASGTQSGNTEVARLIGNILGRPLDLRSGAHDARPWDQTNWAVDISRAATRMGWIPEVDLHNGLSRSIETYQQFQERDESSVC